MHTLKVTVVLIALFVIILSIGIYSNTYLSETAEKIENHVSKIESAAKEGNWSYAKTQLSITKTEWKDTGTKWSMLIDHMEIDNIEAALSRMEEYIYTHDATLALAEASTLKQLIKHIPDKEAFKLKNIL